MRHDVVVELEHDVWESIASQQTDLQLSFDTPTSAPDARMADVWLLDVSDTVEQEVELKGTHQPRQQDQEETLQLSEAQVEHVAAVSSERVVGGQQMDETEQLVAALGEGHVSDLGEAEDEDEDKDAEEEENGDEVHSCKIDMNEQSDHAGNEVYHSPAVASAVCAHDVPLVVVVQPQSKIRFTTTSGW